MSPAWWLTGAICRGRPRLPPRAAEVSSSRCPQSASCDKNVGSTSRQAPRPARENQRTAYTRPEPSRIGVTGSQSAAPCEADPSRQSEERPAPARQLYDDSNYPYSDSLQRPRSRGKSSDSMSFSARRRPRIPVPPRCACNRYLFGAVEPRTFTCPSSPAGATVQPRPSQRLED
jgi:hypothetical protein